MRITNTAALDANRFTVPWDLSQWASQSELLAWLDQDIGSLDWGNPELVSILKSNPAYQPRLLLTLLAYAYALGVCESEEIAGLYYQDQGLRRLFAGQAPATKEIARFRKENRGLLKWCLVELFKRVVREKFELGDALIPAGMRRYLVDAAGARLDVARDMDRAARGAL